MQLLVNIIFSIIAFTFVAIPQRSIRRHVISLIISALWVGALYYSSLEAQHLITSGHRVMANVVKVECSGGSGAYITFKFEQPSGEITQSRQWKKYIGCDHYSVGNEISIVYSPKDPSINFIGFPKKNSVAAMVALFILFYAMMALGNRFEAHRKFRASKRKDR